MVGIGKLLAQQRQGVVLRVLQLHQLVRDLSDQLVL